LIHSLVQDAMFKRGGNAATRGYMAAVVHILHVYVRPRFLSERHLIAPGRPATWRAALECVGPCPAELNALYAANPEVTDPAHPGFVGYGNYALQVGHSLRIPS